MMAFLFFGFDAVEYKYITYSKYTYVDCYWVIRITQMLLALYTVFCLHNGFNL